MVEQIEEFLAINRDFGKRLKVLAHVANSIAGSPRSLTIAQRDKLNVELRAGGVGEATHNIARLPDDLAGISLSAAGASLFAVGALLESEIRDVHALAVLSRNILECCAKAVSVCKGDEKQRVQRAVRHYILDLKDDGQMRDGKPGREQLMQFEQYLQILTRDLGQRKEKVPANKTELVKLMLEPIDGGERYSLLSPYVHANLFTSAQTAAISHFASEVGLVEAFDVAVGAMLTVVHTSEIVGSHRDCDPMLLEGALVPLRESFTKMQMAKENFSVSAKR